MLTPDRPQLGAFVRALFRHADAGTYASLRAFNGNKPFGKWQAVKLNGQGFGPLVDAAFKLAGQCANADPERPVFSPPVATFRSARGASEANLACGLVLTVECDEAAEEARERLEGILGPLTAVVASGGRWEDPISGEVPTRSICIGGSASQHACLQTTSG